MIEKKDTAFFDRDVHYMKQAYDLAIKAFDEEEVPVGALIVTSDGQPIGFGYNRTESEKSQYAHAELFAVKSACQALGDWRLEGCTLYVTLAPCMMCYGLAALSRVERLVYGAESPLYGFPVDRADLPGVYTKHMKFFSSGVMKSEIETLLKEFFKKVRTKESV